MSKVNYIPLKETTRFRKLRELINNYATKEGLQLDEYDMQNIRCYRDLGASITGKNVKMPIVNNGELSQINDEISFLNSTEWYEVYEMFKKGNTLKNPQGEVLLFIRETKSNAYMMLDMSIDYVSNEHVLNTIYGKYVSRGNDLFKTTHSLWKYDRTLNFDDLNNRLDEGYNTTLSEVVLINKPDTLNVNLGKKVKIYKKSK